MAACPATPTCTTRADAWVEGASEEVRDQVPGRLDSRIYRHHYIDPNIGIDTANMVLGRPAEEHLTVALNSMSAGADSRVNHPLSQAEQDCIEAMPDLVALTDRRDEIKDVITSVRIITYSGPGKSSEVNVQGR